jgi:hypothetical protein
MTDLGDLDLGGTDLASVPSVESMLASLAEDNPNLQAVLRIMEARAARAEAEDAEEHVDELLAEQAASEAAARALRREQSRARVAALLAELEELQARNETLAAALGACPECWGRQLGCAGCGGRGVPGHVAVDRQLFRVWVAPAVRAVRATRPRPTTPDPVRPIDNRSPDRSDQG